MSKNGDDSALSFVDTDQVDIDMVQFEEVDEKGVESEVNVQKFDPEEAKHGLAGWVLGGTALIFCLSAAAAAFGGDGGKAVFDTCSKILPPIATLVLGYFFSK